jgi:CRP-like cAMP-binding protein
MSQSIKSHEPITNHLLAALTPQEYQKIRAHLEEFTFTFGEILYEPGQQISHVYFPNSGVVSLLSMVEERSTLEIGLVGNEGMVGLPVFLGASASPCRALVQGAGNGWRMKTEALRNCVKQVRRLSGLLLRYTHSLLTQISQAVVCNRFHTVHARLARWLLMTYDRLETAEFRMTQEFLSNLLGVRREGVTEAAGNLQKQKLIRYVRGQITILDQAGLEAAACHCYAIVKL